MNYYQATPEKPYHLSVGAIVLNDKNEIVCQHYDQLNNFTNIYWLMHSTARPNETLEQALSRGLAKENGVVGEITTYLGVIDYKSEWYGEINKPTQVTKSIAYFLVKFKSIDESLIDKENHGSKSTLVNISADDLIAKMKEQSLRLNNSELDESGIIQRSKEFINQEHV